MRLPSNLTVATLLCIAGLGTPSAATDPALSQPEDECYAQSDVFLFPTAGAEAVEFQVNGETVAELPRVDLPVDGVIGSRVGAGLNLHLTTLTIGRGDHVERWAAAAHTSHGGGT